MGEGGTEFYNFFRGGGVPTLDGRCLGAPRGSAGRGGEERGGEEEKEQRQRRLEQQRRDAKEWASPIGCALESMWSKLIWLGPACIPDPASSGPHLVLEGGGGRRTSIHCCTTYFLMLLVGVLVLLYYPGNHGGTIARSTSTIWKVGWWFSIPLTDAPTKPPAGIVRREEY